METYLRQLHQDIEKAAKLLCARFEARDKALFFEDPFERDLFFVEAMLHAPSYDFAYWTGIKQEELPEAGKLTEAQYLSLFEAILDLWHAMRMEAVFVEGASPQLCYEAVRSVWKEEFVAGCDGLVWDFCSGWAPTCVFGDLCPCWEVFGEEESPM